MANITKALVEHAKAPESGQRFVRDDGLTGFALRVTAAGVKSFIWEGRIKGRVRRMTLGQWPALTVFQARQRVLGVKSAVVNGNDPAAARKDAQRELTFGSLIETYIDQHAKPHKRSWRRDETRFAAHFSKWKPRRLSDLSRSEIVKLQHAIKVQHGPIASNRAMQLLRALFNWAIDEGKFNGDNPADNLTFFKEGQRRRFLSADELMRVNEALLQESDWRWKAYFPLLLLLGLRRSELLAAGWKDVDLDTKTIAIPQTKSGSPLLLPLPSTAADILADLPSRGKSEWVFPSDGASGHLVEVKGAWARIRERAGVDDIHVHDLRHTLASWLVAQGVNLPLVGRTLNHARSSTTERYAHLDLAPVRAALEVNATAMRLGQ
jgi:integrase